MAALQERMRHDLTAAMRDRDAERVAALRGALSAIANAQAVAVSDSAYEPVVGRSADVPRRLLSEADVTAIVAAERDSRTGSAATYDRVGDRGRAARMRAEAAVLTDYLEG